MSLQQTTFAEAGPLRGKPGETTPLERWFVTGAAGCVGRSLTPLLESRPHAQITCLTRGLVQAASSAIHSSVRWLTSDLLDRDAYASAVTDATIVVHLASATGKAPPGEFQRVNVDGLRTLLDACRRTGVKRFVFVSSIAAKFGASHRAHYTRSKQDGEAIVRDSSIPYVIVRPAIVAASASGSWQGLAKMARLPVIPLFGGGRSIVQPIYVGDLAQAIMQIANDPACENSTIEIGGPERLSLRELLPRMSKSLRGRNPRTLSVPLAPVTAALGAVERIALRWLPFTAGQLSSFGNNGTCDSSDWMTRYGMAPLDVDQMISRTLVA